MKQVLRAITLLLLGSSTVVYGQKEPKVLFIGMDGVRSDALIQANTPNLDELFRSGLSTYESWHLGITSSGPSWTSMSNGVWEAKHLVTNNSYGGADFDNWPFIAKRAKEVRSDLKAVQIVTWNPMDIVENGGGGNVFNHGWDYSIDPGGLGQGLVTAAAKIQLTDPEIDYLFIHYDEPDAAGHSRGFSPDIPEYINAIQTADVEIGEVIAALKARPNYANEEWLILGCTDHGGIGTGHGGNSDQERQIWWYASGDFMQVKEISGGGDPGSYQIPSNPVDPAKLANTPVQTDIAVTILDHLLPSLDADEVRAKWDLDGKSWLTSEYYDSLKYENQKGGIVSTGQELTADDLVVFPNPVKTGELNVNIGSWNDQNVSITITDMKGNTVFTQQSAGEYMIQLNVSSLAKGVYILEASNSDARLQKRVVVQ
jgi:hypothetical protein